MVYLNSKWKGVRTDMAVENIGMRAMNKKTLDYVSNQRERTQEAYYLIDDLNKAMGTDEQTTIDKETLQTLLVYFADAFSNESDYLEWCSEVEVEYASEADRESMLTEEVEYLKKENKQYVERLRDMVEDRNNATKEYISLTRENANLLKLKEELEEKNKKLEELQSLLDNKEKQLNDERNRQDELFKMMEKLAVKNEATLSLIEENAKTLSFNKKLKDSKGKQSPNYIEGIDNTQLVQDYINAGYNLRAISDEYSEKYGITYGALRLRLINAGVWRAKV